MAAYDTLGKIYFMLHKPKKAHYFHNLAMNGVYEKEDSIKFKIGSKSAKFFIKSQQSKLKVEQFDPFRHIRSFDKELIEDI